MFLSLALAILGAATPAAAAPTQAAQDKLARLHFEAGKQAYELGRFADAAIEFQRGYDLSKLPLFLLNLGHSLFALDRFEDAIKACEQYLALKPNDPVHVREAEDLLTSAQRHRELQAPSTPAPVTTEAPPPPVTTEAPPPPPPVTSEAPPRHGPAHPAVGWV
ncbi:MAG TPA: tetratricopeptide repeat protein, partial [Polyangia bacterium]|nr:tetratricopeptide repeat protein [Polyangia bacterium]